VLTNLLLLVCVSCRSNELKTVKEWSTDILKNTPGLDKSVRSICVALTTDCPGKGCTVGYPEDSVSIGWFGFFFGAVVKAVAESFEMPAFVPLCKNEGDDMGGIEDADEVCHRCFVPVFSSEEIQSKFEVERVLCSFYGQGGKFVPRICADGGRVLV